MKPDILYRPFNLCASTGHHPHSWRQTTAVTLCKAKKTDCSNPRSYRLIQLEECMGKVLEKSQAQRLSYFIGVHRLVPTTIFGSRPGCSTTDAVISFMHDITLSFDKGWTTSSLTFDIKGYFDFVNHARLLTLMREKHLPSPMIRWAAYFLQERSTTICLDGKLSDMKPIENGIPQGSPISPALSSLYTALCCDNFWTGHVYLCTLVMEIAMYHLGIWQKS